jgi:4-hydroxyacetophenone monooxygenase
MKMTESEAFALNRVDENELRHHVLSGADLPVLLMTVAHTTGDLSILRDEWRPIDVLGVARCDVSAAEEEHIRETCLQYLERYWASNATLLGRPSYDLLRGIGEWFLGNAIEPYIQLLAEELVVGSDDLRRPQWTKQAIDPERPFRVVIIGAGESGIILAVRLKQAGIPFVIYEKNRDVGGTWYENKYPGCRVDINSFVYSYASAPRVWSDYFGTQPENLDYLQQVARENGLYEHTRFGAEVTEACWNDDDHSWHLTVRDERGTELVVQDMVVFAVGQLNRPKLPDIAGRETFDGAAFHSAQWDHAIDLSGKRVGVIGTGASACQFIPQVAKVAEKVSVFVRTATWLLPTLELHDRVEGSARWLMENLPGYQMWYRASLLMLQTPGLLEHVVVDKAYPANEHAVSEKNAFVRKQLQGWLESQIVDRPDLRDAVVPKSPVGAKRILRDNGSWIGTLKRDNVEVVNTSIEEITTSGIRSVDGTHRDFDVILFGTGFQASKFLFPITVKGTDGRSLHDFWQTGARAYLGMTMPGFPNMFCMYGPNTNLVVHGGSIVMFSELTAKYIVDAVRVLFETKARKMEVRGEVFSTYNRRVDLENNRRAWGFSAVNSWYKDSHGRVTQNYPFSAAEFWQRTNAVVPADYRFDDKDSQS